VNPRYSNTRCFETFPFPDHLTPNLPATSYADDPHARAIAAAARDLVEKRDLWLNPPDLIERVPEVVAGYPDRIVPKNPKAATILKSRTLTSLYNTRGTPQGTWLDNLHRVLDAAVPATNSVSPTGRICTGPPARYIEWHCRNTLPTML
jgi:hypothetical protein